MCFVNNSAGFPSRPPYFAELASAALHHTVEPKLMHNDVLCKSFWSYLPAGHLLDKRLRTSGVHSVLDAVLVPDHLPVDDEMLLGAVGTWAYDDAIDLPPLAQRFL